MARTEVPVTMGRRVLSLAAVSAEVAEDRDDPPEVNERDMISRRTSIWMMVIALFGCRNL